MIYGLPPEIWDQVIDHLWSDMKTLKICSLVCRTWYPSAHMHLFRSVKISPSSITKDLQILLHLCHFIREITITSSGIGFPQLDDHFLPCIEAMTNVEILVFQRITADQAADDLPKFRARLSRLPPHFVRSIKQLKLDYVVLPHPEYITNLASLFSHISSLHLSWVFCLNNLGGHASVELQSPPPSLNMNVTELTCNRFDTKYTAKLLTWFGQACHTRYPRSLKLLINNFGHVQHEETMYSAIFRAAGLSLEHLWLTRNHWDDISGKY